MRAVLIEGNELTRTETHQNARIIFSRIAKEFVRADRHFIDACDRYTSGVVLRHVSP